MTVIFPAEQCKILDYNRLLNTLNDMSEEEFMSKLAKNFTITEITDECPRPKSTGNISLYISEKWHNIQIKEELKSGDPEKDLDYQILTDY